MLLQKNPLTVIGTLAPTWLFTYHTPAEEARRLLPAPLKAVTHHGYAFWNVVVCRVRQMRPRHFPARIGVSYWHVAYRLYVRLSPADGDAIEGLYFVRSDCDNPLMSLAGNLLTDFRFHTAPVRVTERDNAVDIAVRSSQAPAQARLQLGIPPSLPPDSAFASLEEAEAFLKYKPYGISLNGRGDTNVVHITRREDAWHGRLVTVEAARWAFFDGQNVRPEICYAVAPIVYQWDRARVYRAPRS
jgi:hypothetical protein